MTQQNPIFQEIDDDLERKRIEDLWKRYGVLIIAGAFAVVAGTGIYSYWHGWKVQNMQKTTSALIDIMANPSDDKAKQIEILQNFAEKSHGTTQSTFARLDAGALASREGDAKKAIAIYDGVAADAKSDLAFRQLADLFSVEEQMDDGNSVALQQRLQPLLAESAPWKYSAMEDSAFLSLRAGDKAKAKQLFGELAKDSNAPQSLAERANDMARFLDE